MIVLIRSFDAALILPPLAIFLLWQDWQHVWHDRRFLNSNFGRFLIPVVISIAVIVLQNTIQFGSPTAFAQAVLGFHTPLLTGLRGLLVSVGRGVIFFSPPLLATIPGLLLLWHRRPAETLLFAALVAVFPLGYATYTQWDGSVCWGPRFLVPLIPFAVLPLGELLTKRGFGAVIVLTLGLAGLLVQIAGTLVDFQRVVINGGAWLVLPFRDSQVIFHWRALLAGNNLDWLPVRLYAVHGLGAALAYAAVPLAMTIWATASLRKLILHADIGSIGKLESETQNGNSGWKDVGAAENCSKDQ